MKTKKKTNKFLSFLTVFIWLASFALAFVIPPTNRLIWVPDALLLIGFWPLLVTHRCRWLWIVFGVLNLFIGYVLLVTRSIPDDSFRFDAKVLATKQHLTLYHESFVWMEIGLISALLGVVMLIAEFIVYMVEKPGKSS